MHELSIALSILDLVALEAIKQKERLDGLAVHGEL